MANKSGGDIIQGNSAVQGNISTQDVDGVAAAGLGAVDSVGGSAFSAAFGAQAVNQSQSQNNTGVGGDGGNDNVNANDTFNV